MKTLIQKVTISTFALAGVTILSTVIKPADAGNTGVLPPFKIQALAVETFETGSVQEIAQLSLDMKPSVLLDQDKNEIGCLLGDIHAKIYEASGKLTLGKDHFEVNQVCHIQGTGRFELSSLSQNSSIKLQGHLQENAVKTTLRGRLTLIKQTDNSTRRLHVAGEMAKKMEDKEAREETPITK